MEQDRVRWNGMGQGWIGWDGTECDEMGWDRIGWNGMGQGG